MGQVCDIDRQIIDDDQAQRNYVPLQVTKPSVVEAEPIAIEKITLVKEDQDSHYVTTVPLREELLLSAPVVKRLEQLGPFNLSGSTVPVANASISHLYLLNNTIKYTGELHNGQPNGKGAFLFQDSSYLQATIVQNEVSGVGRLISCNGDYYEGQFKRNLANGHGRYQEGNVLYQGEFLDNFPHGQGIQTGENFRFIGRFENGVRKQGKLVWRDELGNYTYEGSFKDNLFSGLGSLKDERRVFAGLFKEGRLIEEEKLMAYTI